jgi:invasion protein IalB
VRQIVSGFAFAVILGAAAPAVAQTQPQPQPQQRVATAKAAGADQVICETQEEIGSRLSAHKVCRTRAQWQQLRLDDRSATERTQTQRSMSPPGQ